MSLQFGTSIPIPSIFAVSGMFARPVEVADPSFGRPVLQAGAVPLVAENPGTVRWPGQPVGAQTAAVPGEIGYDATGVASRRPEGVI